MMALRKVVSLLLVFLVYSLLCFSLFAATDPPKETARYIGAKRCGVCHKGKDNNFLYERWRISAHAGAYDILPPEGRRLAKCLGCHTTGYWERDRWYDRLTPAELQGVQCEACHGAGSLYRQPIIPPNSGNTRLRHKTAEAGLIYPTRESCYKCHNDKCPEYKQPLKIEKPLSEMIHPTPHYLDQYGQGPIK